MMIKLKSTYNINQQKNIYLRELAFGDQTTDVGGDGVHGSGESIRININQPYIEPVYGGELGDSGTHLTGTHHAYYCRLHLLCHLCFHLASL
uniref:Putative 3-hydroxyacyl-CoA dehydrogenase B0272.3 n=1 Tax=Rhizophora mucronata TaxID=61149 RepID=A0A2P2JSK2_RHIMU